MDQRFGEWFVVVGWGGVDAKRNGHAWASPWPGGASEHCICQGGEGPLPRAAPARFLPGMGLGGDLCREGPLMVVRPAGVSDLDDSPREHRNAALSGKVAPVSLVQRGKFS